MKTCNNWKTVINKLYVFNDLYDFNDFHDAMSVYTHAYLIIFSKTSSKKLLTLKTHVVKKAVSHPEKFWGQRFQLGVLSTFLNTSKMLLTYIVLHNSSLFFLTV